MFLDLIQCEPLLAFLRFMEDHENGYPSYQYEARKVSPTGQRLWYANDPLFDFVVYFQSRWCVIQSPHRFLDEIQRDLHAVLTTASIGTEAIEAFSLQKRNLLDIVATRRDRWKRLCESAGESQVPEGFVLYRGMDSKEMVRATIHAWQQGTSALLNIPHRGLSSWSFLEGDARGGARHHFMKHPTGVLVKAFVSIDDTFMDVLADDGFFASHCVREAEVIVGAGDFSLPIIGRPSDFRVRIAGKEFGVDDCDEAIVAMERVEF